MALSSWFLKADISRFQYGGAGLVVAGLMVAIWPSLRNQGGLAHGEGAQTKTQAIWLSLLLLRYEGKGREEGVDVCV